MLRAFSKALLFTCMFVMLSGCVSSGLTPRDAADLAQLRQIFTENPAEAATPEDVIIRGLIAEDPTKLASANAKKGDYRLIGLTMGSGATEKDADIVGYKCAPEVKKNPIVFGCIGPSQPVFYKRLLQYNDAMVSQPDFPSKSLCEKDPTFMQGIKEEEESKAAEDKRRNASQRP